MTIHVALLVLGTFLTVVGFGFLGAKRAGQALTLFVIAGCAFALTLAVFK